MIVLVVLLSHSSGEGNLNTVTAPSLSPTNSSLLSTQHMNRRAGKKRKKSNQEKDKTCEDQRLT